jgi:anti-anti-sigma regulatory factor
MDLTNHKLLQAVDVEQRQGALLITLRKGFDANGNHEGWARSIVRACVGPYTSIQMDLRHLPQVSSTFFAGALQVLEAYACDGLRAVILLNVSDRIARTIDMLNLRDRFVVRQHG